MAYTKQHLVQSLKGFNKNLSPVNEDVKASSAAAVLIPILEREGNLYILFTERTLHLEHHAGQICFPGGRYEPNDKDLQATALRELEEEIGFPAEQVEIIATLPSQYSSTGFLVSPFLGILNPPYTFQADPHEVATIFEIPFEHFLISNNYATKDFTIHNEVKMVYFIEFEQWTIWGLTARFLYDLMQVIKNEPRT